MIEVRYKGRLGNNLFQYCFGRILAGELGYALKAQPIPGFPGTYEKIEGYDYSAYPSQVLSDEEEGIDVKLASTLKDRPKKRIVLDGYFQDYKYYKSYGEIIRNSWLRMDAWQERIPGNNDLVMHVRRDDAIYVSCKALPFSYYENIIKNTEYDRLFLLSDNPLDPFFSHFNRYNPTMIHRDLLHDFRFVRAAKKIAMSLSTFSWWAAFLSEAREIYFPIPPYKINWSTTQKVPEERYHYVRTESYKLSPREWLYYPVWYAKGFPYRNKIGRRIYKGILCITRRKVST